MNSEYRELLIGCGHMRDKRLYPPGSVWRDWVSLATLDNNPYCQPDYLFDLASDIYENPNTFPIAPNAFDEIHAYEVLEHIGRQGDVHAFMHQFRTFWSWLKPGGYFCATVPDYRSLWAWGDPSHTRVINAGTLVFLSKKEVEKQIGKTSMSDYRALMGDMDFDVVQAQTTGESFRFILRAVK